MRHRDETKVSTAPHSAVVDRVLAKIEWQWQNRSGSTGFDYDIQEHRGGHLESWGSENVSTALPGYLLPIYGYNPDQGETHRIPYQKRLEQLRRVETNQDFSEQVGRARKTLDKFKDEVVAWRNTLAKHHSVSLTRRLEYIFEAEPELGPKQVAPSLDSFIWLLAYLARHPEFKTPSIAFNRDGTFSAIWSGDKKLRVTLDFTSSSTIRWIFVDSRNGIKGAITGAGIVSLAILSGVLDVYSATSWMKA